MPGAGEDRVAALVARMTLEEKLAQLVGVWPGSPAGEVAPMQDAMQRGEATVEEFARHGLGQVTRWFGTSAVEAADGLTSLVERQRWLVRNTRLGIPALVHEECLTGLSAWGATTFPAPPAWGASFHPELVEAMGAAIGASMASLGVHQGLAPLLDVVRDARWGRVEECVGEDPYLVGTMGTAYVRGLQSAGVVATLKHFVGYSASVAGRNLAPVHAGPRELGDVLLPPFEMAVLDGGARSVMNSYAEVDGVPVAADAALLTGVLRQRWGFTGTVVADYYSVAFLAVLHGVAADLGDAGAQALAAGIDVELPTGNAYLEPLARRVRAGEVDEALVDRALVRVLEQKAALGLLEEDYDPAAGLDPATVDLDPPEHRAIARTLAEESVVLLADDGTLPLALPDGARLAVVGPNADEVRALFGCYSFANHVLARVAADPSGPAGGGGAGAGDGPGGPVLGIEAATVLAALRAELPGLDVVHERGVGVDDPDPSGIAAAVALARGAQACVAVVGDRAGLFGGGTSGEGCDTDSLELPGLQRRLVEELVDTGTPVVLVLLTGRPYAIGWALQGCAAVVQAFFPGEEGGGAVAGVLSGRVNPSGRLPVSLPRSAGAQPTTYLRPHLAGPSEVSAVDPTPVRPFGAGLSYTTFERSDLRVDASAPTSGAFTVRVTVRNTGPRAGADVVQVYGHDRVASVTRPTTVLLGYARVELAAGESVEVVLDVPTTRLALTDRDLHRVVEPGTVEVRVGPDAATVEMAAEVELTGDVHPVTARDRRVVGVQVVRGA